jgi:membrane AbrB-like protein
VACSAVVIVVGYFYFRKVCGFDQPTAFFASSPGGLGELTLLGGALGAEVRTLVLVHSIRVVVVVFSIPFVLQWLLGAPSGRGTSVLSGAAAGMSAADALILLACGALGYVIGQRLKFPGGVMIPALVLSAAVHGAGLTAATVPPWLVALVQVVIGSVAGARFRGVSWREVRATILGSVLWALILVASALATAALATSFLAAPMPSLTLAFSPGGMAEMTVIAFAIGTDVAFVVTCQVCRILAIFLAVPFVFRLMAGRRTT